MDIASASILAARTLIAGSMMRLREVVHRQGELGRREVQIDALLGRELKRYARFRRVLHVQRLARADNILVGQADLEAVADLRA
jgi:hypothetical protein